MRSLSRGLMPKEVRRVISEKIKHPLSLNEELRGYLLYVELNSIQVYPEPIISIPQYDMSRQYGRVTENFKELSIVGSVEIGRGHATSVGSLFIMRL